MSHDGITMKEIDHVLCRNISMVKSCRVFRGPEAPANTDHLPIVATIRVRPFVRVAARKRPLDFTVLASNAELAESYAVTVANRFSVLGDIPDDVEAGWSVFKDTLLGAAKESIPPQPTRRRPWLQPATLAILSQKQSARLRNERAEVRRLTGVFRAMAKLDLQAWYDAVAKEAESGLRVNNMRPAFKAIAKLRRGPGLKSCSFPMDRLDGTKCTSPAETLGRWAEHFSQALNYPPAAPSAELDAAAAGGCEPDAPPELIAIGPCHYDSPLCWIR